MRIHGKLRPALVPRRSEERRSSSPALPIHGAAADRRSTRACTRLSAPQTSGQNSVRGCRRAVRDEPVRSRPPTPDWRSFLRGTRRSRRGIRRTADARCYSASRSVSSGEAICAALLSQPRKPALSRAGFRKVLRRPVRTIPVAWRRPQRTVVRPSFQAPRVHRRPSRQRLNGHANLVLMEVEELRSRLFLRRKLRNSDANQTLQHNARAASFLFTGVVSRAWLT